MRLRRRRSLLLTAGIVLGCREAPPAAAPAPFDGPNVLVLLPDSFRADRLGAVRNGAPLTPILDHLASRAPRFTTTVASSGWTLPSLATLLAGRDALLHPAGREATPWMRPEAPILPEILGYYGYHTIAFYGYNLAAFPEEFTRGFAEVTSNVTAPAPGPAGHEVAEWLDTRATEPFFAFVHNVDLQWVGDGQARKGLDRTYAEERPLVGDTEATRRATAAYDETISRYDASVGEILDAVARRRFTRPTVVLFTSPHGIHLGEHGSWFHGTPFEACVRIPLIVADPRTPITSPSISTMVQIEDITPTVLDLLDIPRDRRMTGRSLRPLLTGAAGYQEREVYIDNFPTNIAVRTPRFKAIRFPGPPVAQILDLATDPSESQPLSGRPAEVQQLEGLLADWLARKEEEASRLKDLEDPGLHSLKEALRERGYWPGVGGGE